MADPSTKDVMRLARARFIQISRTLCSDLSMLDNFFGSTHSNLSCEVVKDVELACLLIASAENVGNKQFDRAIKCLNLCDFLSSRTGNSVQRVVYYFTKALRERIFRETGVGPSQGMPSEEGEVLHPEGTIVFLNLPLITCYLQLPILQVTQFAGIQAIMENLGSAKRVHLIDLAIRSGAQYTALMQAFASRKECLLELLKVTAVGTTLKQKIEETGTRLACFAETLNIPFSFRIVMVTDIKDLNEDMFELIDDEVVAICAKGLLRHTLARPGCLESLMGVLKNLNPCLMVVVEFEADHNSPIFMNRFLEALYFYSSFFDCLDVCMDRCDPSRMTMEAMCLSQEIQNIVAAEGEDRIFRHMNIDSWRECFVKCGMVETEVSMSSFYQAGIVVKNFACKDFCTLGRNGKCLIAGWKGTSILSFSTWKFQQEESWISSSN